VKNTKARKNKRIGEVLPVHGVAEKASGEKSLWTNKGLGKGNAVE